MQENKDTCSGHVLAGADGLETHEGNLHGEDEAEEVEGRVGYKYSVSVWV